MPDLASGRSRVWRRRLVLAALVLGAYLPTYFCGYVYDDARFVEQNQAVHEISLQNAVRYFTDTTTLASKGTKGIYRPLRTLDFAIDWALAGGAPWLFHLENVLYHGLACLFLFAIFMRLLPAGEEGETAAFFGAAVFALHPVNTEAVAWISSRGDVLLLVCFLLAVLLHMKGRRWLALVALVLALLSKESAVVFPAVVLLVDWFRRERFRWRWYAAYGAVVAVYTSLWILFLAQGHPGDVGHLQHYWGGSYGTNLLTMAEGFLYYARLVVVPIMLVVDYHIPPPMTLTVASAISILVLVLLSWLAWRSGRRSRFAAIWFLAAILPMSNLVFPIGIPTAERFLYLPLVGLAFWAGPVLARHPKGARALLACFFVLTFGRSLDYKDNNTFWDATARVAETPQELGHRVDEEFHLALRAKRAMAYAPLTRRDHLEKQMARHAHVAIEKTDLLMALYRNKIRLPPGWTASAALTNKANSLLLLGRPKKALKAVDEAIRIHDYGAPYYAAGVALSQLGRYREAALNLEAAMRKGFRGDQDPHLQLAALWNRVGEENRKRGKENTALDAYLRSWKWLPDPARNREAIQAIREIKGENR